MLANRDDFYISSYTYLEILQGARNQQEFAKLKQYLSSVKVCTLPSDIQTFERVADMVLHLRNRGITPRNTIDIFIALTAIVNNFSLLHNDRDFDYIADKVTDLHIVEF